MMQEMVGAAQGQGESAASRVEETLRVELRQEQQRRDAMGQELIRLTTEATRLGCEVETRSKEAAQARAERDEAKGRMVALHAELDDLRSEMAISRQKVAAAMEGMHPHLPHIPPPPLTAPPLLSGGGRDGGHAGASGAAPGLGRRAQGAPRQARRHQGGQVRVRVTVTVTVTIRVS